MSPDKCFQVMSLSGWGPVTTWPECLCSIAPNKKQTTGHLEKRLNQAQSLFYKHPVFVLCSKSFESKIRVPSLHVFFLAEVITVTLPHPSCSDVRMSNRKHSNLQSTVSIIQCRLFFLSAHNASSQHSWTHSQQFSAWKEKCYVDTSPNLINCLQAKLHCG